MPDRPSLPRRSLTVAVIGNRRFADESDQVATAAAHAMRAHAARASEAAWRQLFTQLPDLLPMDEPPLVIVLSSLAAGADQIGAQAALKAAADQRAVHVVLDAILPFADAEYPGDAPEFRPEEAAVLRSLVGRARSVVRLDANHADPDAHVDAYRRAAQALLDRADLLMAIFDPEKAGKGAGTRETIERAQQTGMPVLSIRVSEDGARADAGVRELVIAALARSGGRGMRFLASRQD
jgi:hypothetical protein